MFDDRYFENYDDRKGWSETNPGWYTAYLARFQGDAVLPINYVEIINWLYDHIDNCEKHARWFHSTNYFCFRFRYEKDYLHFMLRWS